MPSVGGAELRSVKLVDDRQAGQAQPQHMRKQRVEQDEGEPERDVRGADVGAVVAWGWTIHGSRLRWGVMRFGVSVLEEVEKTTFGFDG